MSSTRHYSDSSDDENPKRRKLEKLDDKIEIENRLESLISRVGDKSTSSSLEGNLEGLNSVIETDLGNHKKKIFKTILKCVVERPERLSIYTTLVGLLNADNYIAGGEFIDKLMTSFKDALTNNNYDVALHLMRFLSDLTNCRVVMPSSILDFYKICLEAAFEENVRQTRSDWLVYAVLSCLHWSGKELSEKKEVELDRLLSSIESYLERRNRDFLPALAVWCSEEDNIKDKLDTLWIQLQDMRQSNWRERMLRRPYEAFEDNFRDALQHTIPSVALPPYDRGLTPQPQVSFRIFDNSDIIDDVLRLPKIFSVERFLVEETICGVINASYSERKTCAENLLNIEFREKVPLNYLIIEAIFGQLFSMPESPQAHIFYGVLLIELCKIEPTSVPQVLAQATMILYNKLDTMNSTCVQRFAEWFAYHLSQFQFKWMWDDWMDSVELHLESPKSRFVQETLKKCLRFSYYQRIADIVPPSFSKLLPPDPQPINKYLNSEGGVEGEEFAEKVTTMLKSKCGIDEINNLLSQIKEQTPGDAGSKMRIDIFLQSLLFIASKTTSHTFAAIAKYHSTLKTITEGWTKQESQMLQVCLLDSLHAVWANKPQMMEVVVDKFLRIQLVSCSAVVCWIFSPEMAPWLTSFHMQNILESTVKKLRNQVEKERKELEKNSFRNKNDDHEGMEHERDTSVNLEKFESELEGLQFSILENFISTITIIINDAESNGRSYKSNRFECLKDRLKEQLLKFKSLRILNDLKAKYYETNLHFSILKVFEMVQPLLN